jgi:hypothetical protein
VLGAVLIAACGSSENHGPPDVDPEMTLVTVDRPLLLPGDTVQVTLQLRDATGQPLILAGATVVFSSQGGSSAGAFLPVEDQHDGTYSAHFVGASVGTPLTIAAEVNGQAITSTPPTLRVVGFTRIAAAGATLVSAQTTTGGFSCGIITTGDMYCWGISWFGISGNGTSGTIEPGLEPTLVSGGLRWTNVSAGRYFVCGVTVDGAAYCWGLNRNGRVGNGTTMDALVPTAVSGGHAFVQLSVSQDHTCGVATDGNAYCWGGNDKGELGTRSQAASLTPARVRLFAP